MALTTKEMRLAEELAEILDESQLAIDLECHLFSIEHTDHLDQYIKSEFVTHVLKSMKNPSPPSSHYIHRSLRQGRELGEYGVKLPDAWELSLRQLIKELEAQKDE